MNTVSRAAVLDLLTDAENAAVAAIDSDEIYDLLPGDGQDDYIIGVFTRDLRERMKAVRAKVAEMFKRAPIARHKGVNPKRPTPRQWKNRIRLTGPALTALREEVWKNAGGKCEECGRDVPLDGDLLTRMHLAHRKGRGASGSDVATNCRCLCATCHDAEHNAGGKPCPKKPKLEEVERG